MPTLTEIELAIREHEGSGLRRAFVFFDDQDLVEFTFVTTTEGVQFAQENNLMDHVLSLTPGDVPPGNGDSYEPTALENDRYGRSITGFTDLITDTYIATSADESAISMEFPNGTSLAAVYSRLESMKPEIPDIDTAQEDKRAAFKAAIEAYIEESYSALERQQFLSLAFLASLDGKNNRLAYCRQLGDWVNSILNYSAQFLALVQSQESAMDVQALTWDIAGNITSDPGVTLLGAVQIPD